MTRKVILSVDPGIDDALAICLALFDPRIDVVAVTAVGGNVTAEQATKNVETIVQLLDPPRLPRLGAAIHPDPGRPELAASIFGNDGLGNSDFRHVELHNRRPADKVIADEVRATDEPVTIVSLGPLTTIAAALLRDAELVTRVSRLVIMGGTVRAPGNVTPAAEFNFYCDPKSARTVFRAPIPKTLIPLDVTTQVSFTFSLLDLLPPETTRAGRFLRKVLPFLFRSYRERLGLEGIHLHDAVALAAVAHPELFQTEEMAGDVEDLGRLTTGATVFDQRPNRDWPKNMEVATAVDAAAVRDYVLRGISEAGKGG
ncbi:MAG: nucleoside hydrolase [Planctomycetia bacterium]|nr:nucleoside hydrolase [Planctomycetia bacterium]